MVHSLILKMYNCKNIFCLFIGFAYLIISNSAETWIPKSLKQYNREQVSGAVSNENIEEITAYRYPFQEHLNPNHRIINNSVRSYLI